MFTLSGFFLNKIWIRIKIKEIKIKLGALYVRGKHVLFRVYELMQMLELDHAFNYELTFLVTLQ